MKTNLGHKNDLRRAALTERTTYTKISDKIPMIFG